MTHSKPGLMKYTFATLAIALLSAGALAQTPGRPDKPKMGIDLVVLNDTSMLAYVETQPSGQLACLEPGNSVKWTMPPNAPASIDFRMLRGKCNAPKEASCTARPLNYDPKMKRLLLRGDGKGCGIFPE